MLIPINDQYRITTDTYNVTVEERRVSQAGPKTKEVGREYWVPLSHHGTLLQASQWLLNHEVRISTGSDIERLIRTLKKLHEELENALVQVVG